MKELSPLEALERIRNCRRTDFIESDLNIIETALKKYEKILTYFDIYAKVLNTENKLKAFDNLSKDYEKVTKELSKEIEKNRALEIIKKCGTDIALLKASKNKQEYDQRLCRRVNYGIESDQKLTYLTETQEEFDLLKEVLL